MPLNKRIMTISALILSAVLELNASLALAQQTDPIKEALAGCGVITFDSNAQGFRTASTRENRTVNSGPFNAPYTTSGGSVFRWEATGGNPAGHVRADDLDGEYQEVWTPAFTDSDFSALNGQQLQFDYRNDTGYNQYRLYIAIVGNNGQQYYYYFNSQRIQQFNQQHRQREERDAARRYAQQVIGETLEELGYDVEPGFATLFVEGGVAHIQKPEWGDYYVRLRVKPEVGDLNLNVVRVGDDDRAAVSNEQARRDREEEQWCTAHRTLLDRLEARGIASRQTRALAPGALPVQTVQQDAIQQPGRSQRRQTGLHRRQREL